MNESYNYARQLLSLLSKRMAKQKSAQKKADMLVLQLFIRSATQHVHVPGLIPLVYIFIYHLLYLKKKQHWLLLALGTYKDTADDPGTMNYFSSIIS